MYQQPSHSVRGLYALLFSAVLLSLASCGGGGGGGGAAKSTATAVSAGFSHTCALVGNGTVQCWGLNSNGRLGVDTATASSSTPVQVSGLSDVTAIAAGGFHTCVVQGGAAKCWGSNSQGQLGIATTTAESSTPVQVTDLDSGVTAIAAGRLHTCAILSTGAVKCWGSNSQGQLGNSGNANSFTPVQVTDLGSGVTAIAAEGDRSCAILSTGAARCWGNNSNGELGDGGEESRNEPVDVIGLGSEVMDIAAGAEHTCAIHSGAAKCWGSGSSGKLGIGSTSGATPADGAVMNLDSGVTAIAAGSQHTCAIHNGAAKCWGDNTAGSLGDGSDDSQRTVPVDVMDLSSGVTAVTAGGGHTCAVHNGAVKCWGNNQFGKLGDNTETVYETGSATTIEGPNNNRYTPTTVTGF